MSLKTSEEEGKTRLKWRTCLRKWASSFRSSFLFMEATREPGTNLSIPNSRLFQTKQNHGALLPGASMTTIINWKWSKLAYIISSKVNHFELIIPVSNDRNLIILTQSLWPWVFLANCGPESAAKFAALPGARRPRTSAPGRNVRRPRRCNTANTKKFQNFTYTTLKN